jgi:chorismate mutase / prephenate dehydratase
LSLSRNESVDVLRKKIDQIDEKVVALLNDRAFLAQKIGRSKSQNNQQVYVPHREKQILQRLSRLSQGPLPEHSIRAIFREVVSACRSVEAPLKIAFFGAEGTYSHLAAREKFGSTVTLLPTASISEVFQEVSQGRVSFGVVPIENSTEGVVAHTLDVLVDSELKICAEIYLEIHHNLLSRTGREQDVKRIVSHPQALAQCRQWLTRHFPSAKLDEVASTAHAAMIAAGDKSAGAISSALAKEAYGLQVIAANIEDHPNNISGDDKTSLVFSVKDKPGVLHRMLQPFARTRINLTKIESRPIKNKPWEYMFFIDFKGHQKEARIMRAIRTLDTSCDFIKILGSYSSGK